MGDSIEFVTNTLGLKTMLKKSTENISVMTVHTGEGLKNTLTHIQDHEHNVAYTNITVIALKKFYNLTGAIERVE